jgi:hypothetical protein
MQTVFDAMKQEGICLEGKLTTFRNVVKKLGFTYPYDFNISRLPVIWC